MTIAIGQAGRIDDRLDAINIFLPYLVILGLVTALIGWRRYKVRVAVLGIAITLMFVPPLSAGLAFQEPRSLCKSQPVTLRFIQYNAFKNNVRLRDAARWLIKADPDVIVLQEAMRLAPMLRQHYPYQQSCAAGGGCSTIIASRIRPLTSGGAARGDPENQAALSAAWMRLPVAGTAISVIGVHLGRPWPFQHFPEERRLLEMLSAEHRSDPTIMAGDFNLPGWTFQMRHLEASLGLRRITHGILTWPAAIATHASIPLLGIDHVWTSREWGNGRLMSGPAFGSDHHPIIADVLLCRSPDQTKYILL